jgi:DNA-binding response OmpR family regulator
MTMRVLIVEDDLALALFLQKGLRLEGHDVECVSDGVAAVQYATEKRPELMLLDLGLPQLDGLGVLEALRGQASDTAVLVLTARSEVEARIHCLNAGADDFLQKPFSFHELVARCRAILRRRERFATPVLAAGGIEMNLLERSVRLEGVAMELTTKEFMVLEALLRRNGECCSRVELLRDVWPGTPESGANVVDVYVTYLRRKFVEAQQKAGAVSAAMPVIETVRGSGYRVTGPRSVPGITHALSRPTAESV